MQLKEVEQFYNVDDKKEQRIKGCRAIPKVGDEIAITAVHPGKQERLFVFSHYAVTFCRIADGPLRQ